jgi:hypothetical protein
VAALVAAATQPAAGVLTRRTSSTCGRERQRRYRLVLDAFHPVFSDGSGRRLLDFGCGVGLFLELAHE